MKQNNALAGIVLLAGLTLAPQALAQGFGNFIGGGGLEGLYVLDYMVVDREREAEHPALDLAQHAARESLEAEYQRDVDEVLRRIRAQRAEQFRLIAQSPRDEAAILHLHAEILDLEHWLEQRRLKFKLQVLALLSPEQREHHARAHPRTASHDGGDPDGGSGEIDACPWWGFSLSAEALESRR